jgi:FkbM family methyltransferase
MRKVHRFANGVKVYDEHLLPLQRERYRRNNVHEEQEEAVFLALICGLPSAAVFVDVGSAIGYYALLAKLQRPDLDVRCVEPLPRHTAFFTENIVLNGFEPKDFIVIEKAVAQREGQVSFSENDYSSHVMQDAGSRIAADRVLTVPSIQLSQLCQNIGRTIGLLQMDIQGIEHLVLEDFARMFAAKEPPVTNFLIGTHGRVVHDRCKAAVAALHYRITHDEPLPSGQPDGILAATLAYPAFPIAT